MDKIEGRIILPSGAKPLAKYARYYAQDSQGTVWGSYTPEADPYFWKLVSESCAKIKGQGSSSNKTPPAPCPLNGGSIRLVKAGDRLWMATPAELPRASGGGCFSVTFQYMPATGLFQHLECNGSH